jgi:hypothetical protein
LRLASSDLNQGVEICIFLTSDEIPQTVPCIRFQIHFLFATLPYFSSYSFLISIFIHRRNKLSNNRCTFHAPFSSSSQLALIEQSCPGSPLFCTSARYLDQFSNISRFLSRSLNSTVYTLFEGAPAQFSVPNSQDERTDLGRAEG